MSEKKKIDFLKYFLILFFIVLQVCAFMAYKFMKSEGAACMVNPIEYGVKKFSEEFNTEASCTFSLNKPGYLTVIINKNGTHPIYDGTEKSNIPDFSNFTLNFINP
jgi:hypothetical protein